MLYSYLNSCEILCAGCRVVVMTPPHSLLIIELIALGGHLRIPFDSFITDRQAKRKMVSQAELFHVHDRPKKF